MSDSAPLRRLMKPQVSVKGYLLILLPNNFDGDDITWLEAQLLGRLSQADNLHGAILDFTDVTCTDASDLRRLQALLEKLRSRRWQIALSGIRKGLAELVKRADLTLPYDRYGQDLDAVLDLLQE
jgi:anti-anti-sigma regulatory factor